MKVILIFDELFLAMHGARNTLVNLEELSDEELEQIQKQFQQIGEHYSNFTDSDEETNVAKIKQIAEEEQASNYNER